MRPTLLWLWICAANQVMAQLPAPTTANWPQFRGPGGQGVTGLKPLPTTWNETEHVKWKTPIHGRSWSSPVIWDSQIWLTTASDDGSELYVLCINRETGAIERDVKLFIDPAPNPIFKRYNTYASPTPVVEAGRIYITFGSAGTACLSTTDGHVLWERRDLKINHYRGAGSSLFAYDDLLYLNFDGSDAQFCIALDKATGKTVWKTGRSVDYGDMDHGVVKNEGDYRKAFSTCRIATVNSKPALISSGSKATYAYDPASGKEIWRFEHPDAHSCGATPVIGDGLIYLCPGFGKSAVIGLRSDGSGVLGSDHIAFKISKNAPSKPSCILYDDQVSFVDDNGIASSIDARTGAELWKQRLSGNFSAAPLAGDGKLYFFGESGVTTVIASGKTFQKLAENKLDDGCMATTAVSGSSLFIRTKSALYRVQE